jgi:hypothetical protein
VDEIIKVFVNWFNNPKIRTSFRVSLAVCLTFLLLFLNDILGISRNYILDKRLSQLIELQKLEPNIIQTDKAYNHEYQKTKEQILKNESHTNRLLNFIKGYSFNSNPIPVDPIKPPNSNNPKGTSIDWFDFSARIVFYLIEIFIILTFVFGVIFSKDDSKGKTSATVGLLIVFLVIHALGSIFKFLISLIPIFENSLWINYLINVSIQIILISSVAYLIMNPRRTN